MSQVFVFLRRSYARQYILVAVVVAAFASVLRLRNPPPVFLLPCTAPLLSAVAPLRYIAF